MKWRHEWPLKGYLAALLFITTALTFMAVGTGLLIVRLPQLEHEGQIQVEHEAQLFSSREDLLLRSIEERLDVVASAVQNSTPEQATTVLDRAAGDGNTYRAIYLATRDGLVQAAGVAPPMRLRRDELIGTDLSGSSLVNSFRQRQQVLWGDKHLSALTGEVTVAVAYPLLDGRLLLAELPLSFLLSSVSPDPTNDANSSPASVWLVDSLGDVVADTDASRAVSRINLRDSALLKNLQLGLPPPKEYDYGGVPFHVQVIRLQWINWYVIARTPKGLHNKNIRAYVGTIAAALAGTLVIGLLLAPFWASGLVVSINAIVSQAHQVVEGGAAAHWPIGRVREFNRLAQDLETMSRTLQEREKKFQTIFNTSPVPMAVSDLDDHMRLLDVNDAACRQFGAERQSLLVSLAEGLRDWQSGQHRDLLIEEILKNGRAMETPMRHSDGHTMPCRISARLADIGESRLMVWAIEDITPTRQIEQALRNFNLELEDRVNTRTEALRHSNEELTLALENLQNTRGELLRAEKMAALGSLVAGVAHELNTPLGNSLMAISTLRDELRQFQASLGGGLRKSALDGLMESTELATDISTRNLQRAADLVNSFKQVAADQTSSQRRKFDLGDLVGEIVLTLKPSFSRTPYRIEVHAAPNLELDSYPGPLGQVLTNLITNAIMHGFDGRDHGLIKVFAKAGEKDTVVLAVKDDGRGIAPHLIERIFDPFFTTRMGRGGTGLGLNIAYNATTNLLGGHISVQSQENQGTEFILVLPTEAPWTSKDLQDL